MATIVRTVGPRGYRPKYGVTEDGTVVELYPGPWIEQSGSSDTYNDEFVNINDKDLPSFLTGFDTYRGSSDTERLVWLKDQMQKMEAVGLIYKDKMLEMAKGSPDLTKIVSGALVLIGGKLLKSVPVAGAIVAGAGIIIQHLSKTTDLKIEAYKKEKILKWAAIFSTLQAKYIEYSNEAKSIENRKIMTIVLIVGILGALMYKNNG